MSTLLMRLAAPLQAWGLESKFDVRRSGREPTKSGVIGLAAAALGIRRDEDTRLAELAAMRFGVRIDREGVMMRDFHTARTSSTAYVTQRYYLSDAVFVAGLESEDEALLNRIAVALAHPVFPLYLGRRSCPPAGPLCMGVVPAALEDALAAAPLQAGAATNGLRMVTEVKPGHSGGFVRDVPISFNPEKRIYAFRQVNETTIGSGRSPMVHDPMAELEGG